MTVGAVCATVLLAFPPGVRSFYPACPIHEFTGLLCPGCGATRALAALLHGHVADALHLNALIVCLLPVLALSYMLNRLIWRRDWLPRQLWCAIALSTAIFTVWRNFAR